MPLPPHAGDWMARAEIDYIGPFVKSWAAFNAWYRHASGQAQERQMLEYVKSRPNAVRRGVLPMLDNDNETADALKLKQGIYDLHQILDAIQFEVVRKNVNERISFRSVCINPKSLARHRHERHGQEFKVDRVQGGSIEITVTSLHTQQVKFQHTQEQYDPNEIYVLPAFEGNLSVAQRNTLRRFYDDCNPRPMRDLLQGNDPAIIIGTVQFHCTPDDLFSGLVETIYAMRNALLHGEVEPDGQVLACYEPAYRIVMHFLSCVR